MPTEIEQFEDKIITAIKGALDFRVVDTWPDQADLDELLRNTLTLPACYLIYGGTRHGEKRVIGGSTSDKNQTFRLTIILENLRMSTKDGQRGAYQYIEAIVGNSTSSGIIKGITLAPIPGYLWPVDDSLIEVKYGKFAYGIELVRRSIR